MMKNIRWMIEQNRFIPKWMQPLDLITGSQHSDNQTTETCSYREGCVHDITPCFAITFVTARNDECEVRLLVVRFKGALNSENVDSEAWYSSYLDIHKSDFVVVEQLRCGGQHIQRGTVRFKEA
jgi:hypothetical protein